MALVRIANIGASRAEIIIRCDKADVRLVVRLLGAKRSREAGVLVGLPPDARIRLISTMVESCPATKA